MIPEEFNTLIIVADSCRWDSFKMAHTPHIDKRFDVVEAGAVATFTYPAHMAMYQGFFPSTGIDRPIYNRFNKNVYRWFYRTKRNSISELHGTGSIPKVLRDQGYRTVSMGGVSWFKKRTPMRLGFEDFLFQKDAEEAAAKFIEVLDREPFYALLNFGTTHRTYQCPTMPEKLKKVRSPSSRNDYRSEFQHDLHLKQIKCMSYLDGVIKSVLEWVESECKVRTMVCFCADHGDCMGEDGCFGHGFYHPSVMSVPVGWSIFMPGDGAHPVTTKDLQDCGFNGSI